MRLAVASDLCHCLYYNVDEMFCLWWKRPGLAPTRPAHSLSVSCFCSRLVSADEFLRERPGAVDRRQLCFEGSCFLSVGTMICSLVGSFSLWQLRSQMIPSHRSLLRHHCSAVSTVSTQLMLAVFSTYTPVAEQHRCKCVFGFKAGERPGESVGLLSV